MGDRWSVMPPPPRTSACGRVGMWARRMWARRHVGAAALRAARAARAWPTVVRAVEVAVYGVTYTDGRCCNGCGDAGDDAGGLREKERGVCVLRERGLCVEREGRHCVQIDSRPGVVILSAVAVRGPAANSLLSLGW